MLLLLWLCEEDNSGEMPAPVPLKFSDLEAPETFFAKGFGNNNSMLLASPDGLLKDRELVQKLLLLGRSEIKMSKVVDVYHVVKRVDGKRRKARPSQATVSRQSILLFFLKATKVADFGISNFDKKRLILYYYHV